MADSSRPTSARTATGRAAAISPVLSLALLWAAMVLLVDPRGNFPLNDDWSYGRAAFTLAAEGRVELLGWTAMPLVAQLVWGALFCVLFGPSFTVLRASTLLLGLAGVLLTHALAREAGASRRLALVCAASVAANPVYLLLASTFMTDVPFFAAATASFYAFVRGLRRSSPSMIALGTALAVVATLVRQFGLVVPVAFAVAVLVRHGVRPRSLVLAALPAAVPAAALAIFERVLASGPGLPAVYRNAGREMSRFLARDTLYLIGHPLEALMIGLVYGGLFCLPVLIASWSGLGARGRAATALWILAAAALAVAGARWGIVMPLTGNILWESGLGPPTLRDVYVESLPHLPAIPVAIWIVLTGVGIASGGLVLWRALKAVVGRRSTRAGRPPHPSVERPWLELFCLTTIGVYWVLFAIGELVDRYLLFIVPPLVLLLVRAAMADPAPPGRQGRRIASAAALIVVLLYAAFAVAGTHDYLAWNRARWQALQHLVADKGVSPASIDGGFEFNGFHLYEDRHRPAPGKSWWWVRDDEYLVAFGPVEGWTETGRWPYTSWLFPGQRAILALKRRGPG